MKKKRGGGCNHAAGRGNDYAMRLIIGDGRGMISMPPDTICLSYRVLLCVCMPQLCTAALLMRCEIDPGVV